MTTAITSILVIEDEMIVAQDLKNKLCQMGYQVPGFASTGEEAIRMAQAFRPVLVLADIRLRGSIDGIEVARQIKDQCDSAVIFLTAHSDRETLDRARSVEPYGYLIKPFDVRELQATVEMVLAKHTNDLRRHEQAQRTVANKDIAIKEIIGQIDEEKAELAKFFQSNVDRTVLPLLRRIEAVVGPCVDPNVSLIQERLANIMSPFVSKMERLYGSLSPREIEVGMLIRDGLTTKDIAAVLNTSPETVRHQRKDIRRKLGIGRRKVNLKTFLKTL